METAESLDAQVRRADPDRWLASRFITDEIARADVIAIHALDMALARVPLVAHEPMMAEIRLTWWREAIEEIFAGKPARGHPVLIALAEVVVRRKLALGPFLAMVDARFSDIDAEALEDEAAFESYADGMAGAPLALALAVLGKADSASLRPASLAWTLAKLGQDAKRLPAGWSSDEFRRRGLAALEQARLAARDLSVAAFPAVAHLSLVGTRLRGRAVGALEARARLILAVLTGRI